MVYYKQRDMDPKLKAIVERMSPMHRKYAEYRAKGERQPDAAEHAGSTAKDRKTRARVGWNIENTEGVREYIMYLQEQRARASQVDEAEIADMLREVYENAMEKANFNAANKAVELLGNTIGIFKNDSPVKQSKSKSSNLPVGASPLLNSNSEIEMLDDEQLAPFKEENEGNEVEARVREMRKMMKQFNVKGLIPDTHKD